MKKRILTLLLALVFVSCSFASLVQAQNQDQDSDQDSRQVYINPHLSITPGDGVKLSEIYDGGEVVLDQEDFVHKEDYEKYLKVLGLPVPSEESSDTYDIDPAKASNVTATGLYKASLGSKNNAIQSFYINGSDIYICQNYNNVTYNGTTYSGNCVLLSRCTLSGNTFTRVDDMLLRGVGHGQTLDMYTYGGVTYLLISCGSYQYTTDSGATAYWSTQIGRIQYSANTVVSNSNIKRLIDLNYSNDTNTSFSGVKRVDAALSSDKTKLLIWKRNQNDENQFSVYDFSVINQQLSSAPGYTVSFQNNTTLQNACSATVTNPSYMPGSVQGVELSNASGGVHAMYVSSGNEAKSQNLRIVKFHSTGNYVDHVNIQDTGVWTLYGLSSSYNAVAEIEGIKISGNDLQFVLVNTGNKSQQVIAYIPKSSLN